MESNHRTADAGSAASGWSTTPRTRMLDYDCLSMKSSRAPQIWKLVGIVLLAANCVRMLVWRHSPESVAVIGDILGFFGAISYFYGIWGSVWGWVRQV